MSSNETMHEPPRVVTAVVLVALGLLAALPALGWGGRVSVAALAIAFAALVPWLQRKAERPQAGWLVALGALGLATGLGVMISGAILAGFWVLAVSATAVFTGTQLALGFDPPGAGRDFPAPLSLRSNGAVAVDTGLQWFWQLGGHTLGRKDLTAHVADLEAAAERNRKDGVIEDPRLAHPTPPILEKAVIRKVSLGGLGSAEHLSFESEAFPRDPEVRDAYLSYTANRTAHAWLWRHPDGPRPTLVCVHGFGMGRPGFDARAFEVPRIREQGIDVATLVLPLHGARSIGRRSGQGFMDGHPLATNAAFEQAVSDLRRLIGWLRREGAPAVGIMGMSLGGYITALVASIERGLACAIPQVPVVRLYENQRRALREDARKILEDAGITEELVSEAWASHDPLRHEPAVAPEGRLIIAGLLDRICPPDQAEALWEHWKRPPIHWFPGSHLVPIGRDGQRDRIAAHLAATLLEPSAAPLALTRFRASGA